MNDLNMNPCALCPRECKVNREIGNIGYCHEDKSVKLARAALHMWEEPCISGYIEDSSSKDWAPQGSGAVFFSGCNMGCIFCQNKEIASGKIGKEVSVERLAEIFLELQEKRALNINLVTPSHYVPQIIRALDIAKRNGLTIPIVYNTSSFEKVETLKALEGYIDVYLPDFKYMSSDLASRYSFAPTYPDIAKDAIREMVRQQPKTRFYSAGNISSTSKADNISFFEEYDSGLIIQKGVIVRHMILPGCTEDSKRIIKYLYETYHDSIYISIMNQYTPLEHVSDYPEINRTVTSEEYDEVVDYAINLGVENGFIQEGETQSESFIPTFNYEGV